ncbi:hypothetical protein [Persicobacter psychrovividus]|uniref:DUF3575 domain-containing protein n=1 Tax=Persicobacter psychrovividus TaxID=387638 RepID=A0ABM7VIW3_9BACT|nr:hypothetical protein PEPS_32070 [Persicobacter psychrovividus]
MKNIYKGILLLIVFLSASMAAKAQDAEDRKLIAGNSVAYIIPSGSMADTYTHGFGVFAHFDYPIGKYFAWRLDVGWNDIAGDENQYVDVNGQVLTNHPERTIWEFSTGLQAKYSVVYVEARVGYLSSINSVGIIPAVGLRLGRVDLQGSYTMAGGEEYASIRLGYYWSK